MIYKCGIIGCGNIAGGYQKKYGGNTSKIEHVSTHAGAYEVHAETKLICIADPNIDTLRGFSKTWLVKSIYNNYIDMLTEYQVDILSIATPTELHYEVFKYAVEKQIKAIWLEKPLSYDLQQAEVMCKLVNNSTVSVNYYRRWNSTLKSIKDKLSKGIYGSVSTVTVRYTKGLYCNASHLIDLVCWYFGKPCAIKVLEHKGFVNKDPCLDFNLYYDNFTINFMHIPNVSYVFLDVDILTERGRVLIEQRGQQIREYESIAEPNYAEVQILSTPENQESAWRNYAYSALDEIVNALQGKATISCTVEDAFMVMKICEELSSTSANISKTI